MIELLVVVLIIGILMALLLPAIGGAVRTAKEAQVTAELNNLATALADFNSKFNAYPPSRLYCNESGNYAPPTTAFSGMSLSESQHLVARSAQYIRKFWPRVQLTFSGTGLYNTNATCLDFNGNSTLDNPYILNGPECLVFFLGGIPQATTSGGTITYAMTGFGKNPANPFRATTGSDNRVQPLYEFNNGRLDDSPPDATSTSNGVPCYLDPLGSPADSQPISASNDKRPYAYFSSYGDGSYDPEDYNAPYEVSGDNVLIGRKFTVTFASGPYPSGSFSVGPNPYTVSPPVLSSGTTTLTYTSATFHNPSTFQLMSSGIDRQWGIGGIFTQSGARHTPFNTGDTTGPDSSTYVRKGDLGDPRLREVDNLTNFSGGRMN